VLCWLKPGRQCPPRRRGRSRPSPGPRRQARYVAHELRTPLATQRALLELALADPDTDAELWQEIGSDVLDACKQQERLLESCLALSRSQGAVTLSETVDLAAAVATRLRALDLRSFTVTENLAQAPTIGDPELIERLLDRRTRSNTIASAARLK
jgi:signal transduction histidine kinase